MSRGILQSCCLFGLLLSVGGCRQQPTGEREPQNSSSAVSSEETPESNSDRLTGDLLSEGTSKPEKVDLTTATFDELQASIAASKGKVIVVDYWSTQCTPCMTEFPGLVAIHNELPHDQVRCVSASLDYEGLSDFPIEEARKASLEFLEQQEATLDNFILSEDSLTVMDEKLKIASIPAVFVFGVDGKLARLFDESSGESFTYEKDVTPFVKELVAQSFPADSAAVSDE
jgi:thiol-disulfide isomerase/thioredoxin